MNKLKSFEFWEKFRDYVSYDLNCKKIFLSKPQWSYFVLLITLIDSILAVCSFWIKELDDNEWYKSINIFFLSIYLFDIFLKIIVIGI